ncbi:hypothetical protein V2J09_012024 [Rumex salicifolius]
MEGYRQHPYDYQQQTSTEAAAAAGDRFPQWSAQETKEFLAVRAELDRAFMETKRNKALWEVIATRLKELGFSRSAEQCKSKWKNLVTRYKGCETMEPEALRQQFPYYNELHAIFSARLHHMLWREAEAATPSGSTSKKRKTVATTMTSVQMSSDDDDDEDDVEERESNDGDDYEENIKKAGSSKRGGRRKKKKKGKAKGDETELTKLLESFTRQQSETEERWRETWEAREAERRKREDTWRSTMEALEAERRRMERSWREREEQRRVREEARAIKRDALITLLLNKLRRDDNI